MTPFVEGSKTDETMVLEIRTEAAIEEEGECSNGEKTWWGFCNPGNVFFFFFSGSYNMWSSCTLTNGVLFCKAFIIIIIYDIKTWKVSSVGAHKEDTVSLMTDSVQFRLFLTVSLVHGLRDARESL